MPRLYTRDGPGYGPRGGHPADTGSNLLRAQDIQPRHRSRADSSPGTTGYWFLR